MQHKKYYSLYWVFMVSLSQPHTSGTVQLDILAVSSKSWYSCYELHRYTYTCTYLTEVDIKDSVDDGEGELGGVDGEEPLGGVHVCLYPTQLEVLIQLRHVLLIEKLVRRVDNCYYTSSINNLTHQDSREQPDNWHYPTSSILPPVSHGPTLHPTLHVLQVMKVGGAWDHGYGIVNRLFSNQIWPKFLHDVSPSLVSNYDHCRHSLERGMDYC